MSNGAKLRTFQILDEENDVLKEYAVTLMPGDCYSEMKVGDSQEYGIYGGIKNTQLMRVA